MKKFLSILLLLAPFMLLAQDDIIFYDSFEDYEDWTTENIGDWTLLDLDGEGQMGITGVIFPGNDTQPFAGKIINSTTAESNVEDINIPEVRNYDAKTGEKVLGMFAALLPPNNDWIISPKIQLRDYDNELKFSVKTAQISSNNNEKFRVLISTTDTDPESFTEFPQLYEDEYFTESDWTEFSINLDEYANQEVYLAINYFSSIYDNPQFPPHLQKRATSLLLDDFTVLGKTQEENPDEWVTVNSGTTYILYGMSFPPGQNSIGYASGMQYTWDAAGVIIKTTDGGNNWAPIWPTSGSIDGVEGIWFLNENVGFAAGWNNYFIKTTDGGQTWTEVNIGGEYVWYWQDVVFWDDNNGVATAMVMDDGEAVFITSDGGNNWVRATSGTLDNIVRVCYVNQNTLFAIGLMGNVYKSTDKGYNWTNTHTLSGFMMGIEFADENFGIIGAEERMYYTTDGGETWTMYYTGYEHFYGVKAFSNGTAYWAGTERIYKTTDYGQNIEMEFDGGYNFASFYRVRSTDNGTLFASGSGGTIVKKAAGSLPLQADFSASETTIDVGESVTFTDLSQGNILEWNWLFPGGTPSSSNEQNPVITYNEPGTFDVSLTVSDNNGTDVLHIPNMITVVQPNTLIPDFEADKYFAGTHEPVTFTDLSEGNITQWNWVFEGGTPATSTEQHPVVIYEEYGTYDVTLTISDGVNSATLTKEDMIDIGCINVPTNSLSTFSLYPNPASQTVSISLNQTLEPNTMLVLFNAQGQSVYTKYNLKCDAKEMIQVALPKLPAGYYTLGIGNSVKGFIYQNLIIKH